jgi:thiol-disulfide isomerase/thioredoxin
VFQCIVANVDADAESNRPLATKYNIQSFPTLKFFPKGGEPIDYEGGRQEADFVEFLNEKCGTYRAVGGGLNDQVCVNGFVFKFLITSYSRLVVIPSSMHWLANSSLLLALRVMPFIKKHPPLLPKSVLLPRNTYG